MEQQTTAPVRRPFVANPNEWEVIETAANQQTPTRTRPFVADPNEWEVISGDEYEVVDDTAPPQSTTERVGSGAWNAATGLASTIAKASGIPGLFREGPLGAIKDQASLAKQMLVDPVVDQATKAKDAYDQGRMSEAIGHAASTVPIVGPLVGHIGEEIGAGRSPELIGELATGLAIAAAVKTGGAVADAMPSATRAGATFQDVMGAAKSIPVETKAIGDAALRVQQLAERGATMPQAVRKLLLRMTDPNKAQMAYAESRDFASNISRLSADEMGRLTPVMAREVANLRVAINEANAQAAKAAGKGAEYKSAMREYANAMRLREALSTVAKRGLPYATTAGAGYWLTRQIKSMLGGSE